MSEYYLELNAMQLVTPGGNHCCLIANDVTSNNIKIVSTPAVLWQVMYIIKDWLIHLLILSTVYEHDKQKTIVY